MGIFYSYLHSYIVYLKLKRHCFIPIFMFQKDLDCLLFDFFSQFPFHFLSLMIYHVTFKYFYQYNGSSNKAVKLSPRLSLSENEITATD